MLNDGLAGFNFFVLPASHLPQGFGVLSLSRAARGRGLSQRRVSALGPGVGVHPCGLPQTCPGPADHLTTEP